MSNKYSFISSFQIFLHFISFSCVMHSYTVLNRNGEKGNSCLVTDLMSNVDEAYFETEGNLCKSINTDSGT